MVTVTQQLVNERIRLRDELISLVNSGKRDRATEARINEINQRLAEIHAENERRFARTQQELEQVLRNIGV